MYYYFSITTVVMRRRHCVTTYLHCLYYLHYLINTHTINVFLQMWRLYYRLNYRHVHSHCCLLLPPFVLFVTATADSHHKLNLIILRIENVHYNRHIWRLCFISQWPLHMSSIKSTETTLRYFTGLQCKSEVPIHRAWICSYSCNNNHSLPARNSQQ